MNKLARTIRRTLSKETRETREVLQGTYSQPIGLGRGIVTLGRCGQEVVAARSSNHDKGDDVLVVRTSGGAHAVLPSSPSAGSGPSSASTLTLGGEPYSSTETFAVRAYVHATKNLYDGVLTIPSSGSPTLEFNSTPFKTLPFSGLDFSEVMAVPDGGPGVGSNSLVGSGVSAGLKIIQLYDGDSDSIATASTGVDNNLDEALPYQPYPGDNEWLLVGRRISVGVPRVATLRAIPFDLAGGAFADVVDTSGLPSNPNNRFWSQFGFSDQVMVLPKLVVFADPPVEAYVFDRKAASVTVEAWGGSWDFERFDGATIGMPYGDDSFRIKANQDTLPSPKGGGSICSLGVSAYAEASTWSPTNVVNPAWSSFPNDERIIVGGNIAGSVDESAWIGKRDGSQQDLITISWSDTPPTFTDLNAIWIIRE